MHLAVFSVLAIIIAVLLAMWIYSNYQKFFYVEGEKKEPSFLRSLGNCIFFFEAISLLVILIVASLISNFGGTESTETFFDTEPVSYQYLIVFEINKEKVFSVKNEGTVTFMLGGNRPGPTMVTTREVREEDCCFFYDCPETEEPYVEIHTMKIGQQKRFGPIYMPSDDLVNYQYRLHLHPNETAGL